MNVVIVESGRKLRHEIKRIFEILAAKRAKTCLSPRLQTVDEFTTLYPLSKIHVHIVIYRNLLRLVRAEQRASAI